MDKTISLLTEAASLWGVVVAVVVVASVVHYLIAARHLKEFRTRIEKQSLEE